jgi:formylglycine-generating enzyme required for sulfatase activity
MALCPVTQAQWQAVMGGNPSRFKAKNRPVERVSWHRCRAFCTLANEEGLASLRLPTEDEWEYACRSGTTTPFFFGETINTDQANYHGDHVYGSGQKGVFRYETTLVQSFPPNAWGLYDRHGNVWEWCAGPDIPPGLAALSDRDIRILRGGCWRCYPVACRSARRYLVNPNKRTGLLGFRVCLAGADPGKDATS